ncbi:MAG: phytanoyl-CoA dioxygenase family protein [Myxococcota bacterium]
MLTEDQSQGWEQDGFFFLRGFVSPEVCSEMLERVVRLARRAHDRRPLSGVLAAGVEGSLVVPEARRTPGARAAEDHVSKIFKLHRDPVFGGFARDKRILDLIESILGPDLDCFLSQFIFKNPEAMGQPWHQDSYYFRFSRTPQVGVWLAVTEATLENGCLHVLPGSHQEPTHEHVLPSRADSNLGYMEIVDHDTEASVPVLMDPGDVLVFHSHLMHSSSDNRTERRRAAMVYHYTEGGTVDLSGQESPVNDWLPVRRRQA